jgi:hypothetical protein
MQASPSTSSVITLSEAADEGGIVWRRGEERRGVSEACIVVEIVAVGVKDDENTW